MGAAIRVVVPSAPRGAATFRLLTEQCEALYRHRLLAAKAQSAATDLPSRAEVISLARAVFSSPERSETWVVAALVSLGTVEQARARYQPEPAFALDAQTAALVGALDAITASVNLGELERSLLILLMTTAPGDEALVALARAHVSMRERLDANLRQFSKRFAR